MPNDDDNVIRRFHVQRRSDKQKDWKNMTGDTGASYERAKELHKEFTDKLKDKNRHNAEYRIKPLSQDELKEANSGDGWRKGRNDNNSPVGDKTPKQFPINNDPYKVYGGRLPYRPSGPNRKPVNDT